jgi:hypothetical protein
MITHLTALVGGGVYEIIGDENFLKEWQARATDKWVGCFKILKHFIIL